MNKYNLKEEIINAITHGMGVIFGIVALTILLFIAISKKQVVSIVGFSIYGSCLILMYLFSTLYHSITNEKAKKILRVFDHSAIFMFIAGTYTPILLMTTKGTLRITLLVAVWVIAVLGIVFKILSYRDIDKHKVFSLVIYIAMGWLSVFTIKSMINNASIKFFYWLLTGGLLYTFGTIFYANKRIPFNHAIWHLFVLAASVVHFLGIVFYLA